MCKTHNKKEIEKDGKESMNKNIVFQKFLFCTFLFINNVSYFNTKRKPFFC